MLRTVRRLPNVARRAGNHGDRPDCVGSCRHLFTRSRHHRECREPSTHAWWRSGAGTSSRRRTGACGRMQRSPRMLSRKCGHHARLSVTRETRHSCRRRFLAWRLLWRDRTTRADLPKLLRAWQSSTKRDRSYFPRSVVGCIASPLRWRPPSQFERQQPLFVHMSRSNG